MCSFYIRELQFKVFESVDNTSSLGFVIFKKDNKLKKLNEMKDDPKDVNRYCKQPKHWRGIV